MKNWSYILLVTLFLFSCKKSGTNEDFRIWHIEISQNDKVISKHSLKINTKRAVDELEKILSPQFENKTISFVMSSDSVSKGKENIQGFEQDVTYKAKITLGPFVPVLNPNSKLRYAFSDAQGSTARFGRHLELKSLCKVLLEECQRIGDSTANKENIREP